MSAIRVELQLADGSFTSGMLRAGQSLQDFNTQLMRTNPRLEAYGNTASQVVRHIQRADVQTKGFLGTLRDVSIVTGLVSMGLSKASQVSNSFVGEIVKVNAEMERLRFQMQGMSTAADPIKDAATNVAYLREQARTMPFSLKTITSSFVKLKASGLDPMDGSLRSLADGIAAFGGNDEAFNRIVLGITQMSGKSVIQMEEMRQQLGESMPAAMQIMARSMGVSVGELTKQISTGRVEAKTALQGFFAELNRAYGGEAQRMMETFSGQVSQLGTNLTNLATNEGGAGFFDQVKTQLRDINRFLQSDMANKMATQLGQGLASTIGYLRTGASMLWEWRGLIGDLGVAMAVAFGGLAVTRGISSLIGAIDNTRASLVLARAQFALASREMAMFNFVSATQAGALTKLHALFNATAVAARGVAIAVGAIMPWVAAIGVAVYTAGSYFGWFSDKVSDAYEELKRYGAETKKQAKDIVANREQQLIDRLNAMQKAQTMTSPGAWDKRIAETKAELKALQEEGGRLIDEASKREKDTSARDFEDGLRDRESLARQSYLRSSVDLQLRHQKEQAEYTKQGKSTKKLNEQYQQDLLKLQQSQSKARIAIYEEEQRRLRELLKSHDEQVRKNAASHMAIVDQRWIDEQKVYEGLKAPDGVHLTSAPLDDEKAIAKGQKALESLLDDTKNLRTEFEGANGAFAEMQQRIARGDFGSLEDATEETKKLHQALLDATAEKETLDNLMEGRKKIDGDIKNVEKEILEKQLELLQRQQGKDLNSAEKVRLGLDNGLYKGLGPIENIRKAIVGVTTGLNTQGEAANQLARVMQQNTFSDATVKYIDGVTAAVNRLIGAINGTGTSLNGLSFANLGNITSMFGSLSGAMPDWMKTITATAGRIVGGANMMSSNMAKWGDPRQPGWASENLTTISTGSGLKAQVHKAAAAAFEGFVRELESSGYKIKSFGGHNVRNKRGGNSLSEHSWGNAIDINPGKNPFGKQLITDMPANISEMAAKWGLSWGGDWKSVKDAMHFEWRGNTKQQEKDAQQGSQLPVYTPVQTGLIETQTQKTEEYRTKLTDLGATLDDLAKKESDQDLADWIKKTATQTKDLGENADETGRRYKQLVNDITSGKFGKSEADRNPESDRYKNAIAAAKEYDKVDKQVAEQKKNNSANDRDLKKLEEDRLELNRRLAEAQKRASDPNYKADSNALQELITRLDEYVERVKTVNGGNENAPAVKAALEARTNMIRQQRKLEATEAQVSRNKEVQDLRNSLLSQTQLRQQEMQKAIAAVDAWVVAQRKAGMDDVEITRMAEEQKALIRAKYAQEASPLQKQFKEWSDLQSGLAQASTRWVDSMAGGISDLIMGTGDLRSAIQGIIKDIVNMGVKYMMSNMFSKGGGGGKGGKGIGAAKGAMGGGKKLFPTAHTGGIIGQTSLTPKFASSAAFMNAPKFHTGGIIGGPKLLPSEVPIIAQKGEGVFTPEQMSMMGGFQQNQAITISAPITVTGSAGTPEQNDDLANKMAKQMEQSMRGMVAEEFRKQARPGNFMNQRSR